MYKNSKIIIFIFIFTLFLTITINASNVIEINQLVENASTLDNTEVSIQGELIGEALERGEYAWININDTTNAIGVWVKQSDINQIQFYGDYKHKGDIVKITGTFNKACVEHGGDVDIHCTNIELVEKGYIIKEELSFLKIITAVVLITIMMLVLVIYSKLMIRQL